MAELTEIISTTLEHVKAAHAYVKEQGSTEHAEGLMEAREGLQEVREAIGELTNRISTLEDDVAALRASLQMKAKLVRNQGVYWTRGDPDPWCPNCWENEQRAVHMNPTTVLAGRLCECKRCSYSVNLDNSAPPKKWPTES